MALQHHEFELLLREAERLRLFVQAGMAEREMYSALLKKVELACRRLELEAREFAEKASWAEAERDTAWHEAAMAKLAFKGAVNTRAQIESELSRVQRAEEDFWRAELERGATQEALAAELALIIELGALKDDFAAFREKAAADREAMEAEFDSSGDTLFNYGYDCCAFTHNICGSKPQIPKGMPNPSVPLTVEFFANPRCPPSVSAAASALDPITVSGEDRSENSSAMAGEEAILPMDREEAVLTTDLPAEYSLSPLLRRDLFYLVLLHQTIFFSFLLRSFWVFWHCTIQIYTRFLFNVFFEYICGLAELIYIESNL